MKLSALPLAACLAATTRAQIVIGSGDDRLISPSFLCNKTFADANATGVFTFDPGVEQGPQDDQPDNDSHYALNAQYAITVYENIGAENATADVQYWYNTNGANYSDNAGLWYDVCVLSLDILSINTWYRGANDSGDCMETLDEKCVSALKEQARDFTIGLFGNATPNPGSNLTQGSLSHVCYDIGKMMTDEFPKQCNKFFDGPASVNGFAMTGYNDSFLYDGCSLTEQQENGRNKTFHRAGGDVSFLNQLDLDEDDQTVLYSNLTQLVYPVMTVFMPIADIEAKNSIGTVIPHMTCAHVNHINPGSLEPYAAPSPKPIGGGSSLSGGAIAGIVIGVLAAVAIALAALWFFWLRKRRAAKKASALDDSSHPPPAYTADAKLAEAPASSEQTPLTELSGQALRPELPTQKSGPRVELAGEPVVPAELPASGKL